MGCREYHIDFLLSPTGSFVGGAKVFRYNSIQQVFGAQRLTRQKQFRIEDKLQIDRMLYIPSKNIFRRQRRV